MAGQAAARLRDPIAHSNAHSRFWAKVAGGIVGGIVVGALACAAGALIIGTGGMATPLVAVAGATLLTAGGAISAVGGAAGGYLGAELVDAMVPVTYTVTGKIKTASPNVFVNSKSRGAARATPAVPIDEVECSNHSPKILTAEGAETVYVNAACFARQGDAVECGAIIHEGSPNVFVGGPTARVREVADEVPWYSRYAGIVIGLVTGGLGLRTLLKAPGTLASKLPCLGGMLFGTGIGVLAGAVGGPVHAATGAKILSGDIDTDFELPGPLPMRWLRFYNSLDTRTTTGHGQGWGGELFVQLDTAADGHITFMDEQGRPVEWEPLEPGFAQENIAEGYVLHRSKDGQYAVQSGDGLYRLFEPAAPLPIGQVPADPCIYRLARLEDENGNYVALRYRSGFEIQNIADSTGRLLELTYAPSARASVGAAHAAHRIAQIAIAVPAPGETPGVLVRYEYNAQGQLAAVINAEGVTSRAFTYNEVGLMSQHRTPSGLTSHYEWTQFDDHPRVVRQWNDAGQDYHFEYRKLDNPQPESGLTAGGTRVIDQLGRRYEWRWDTGYNILLGVDPLSQCFEQQWNEQRQLLSVTDANGNTTTYSYDPHGNLAAETDPLGRTTHTTWLGFRALPTQMRLPDGSQLSWAYDKKSNLLAETAADGSITQYVRDLRGLPLRITDAKGGVKQLSWDERALLQSYTDCSGQITRYTFDGRGYLSRVTDALGQVTELSHDSLGRLRARSLPDASHETFAYDAANRLVQASDPLSRVTQLAYNAHSQLTARRDAEGRQVQLTYDIAQRLSTLVNENGQHFGFQYDAADRMVEETRVGGQRVTVEYDANGWPIAVNHHPGASDLPADPKSSDGILRTQLIRDAAGRLVEKRTASHHYHYAYDPLDQLTQAQKLAVQADGSLKPLHTSTFAYDNVGNLIEETATDETTGQSHTLRHSHDALGNRTQTQLPALPGQPHLQRALNYLHYGSGHLHQINYSQRETQNNTQGPDALAVHQLISDIERDALHREVHRTQGQVQTRYALDPLGRRQGAWSQPLDQRTQPLPSQRHPLATRRVERRHA